MNLKPFLESAAVSGCHLRRAAGGAATVLILLGASALPLAVQAQSNIPSIQVQFPKGSSGTALSGSLTGRTREARDYVLGAKGGQTMTVSLSTTSNWTHFNVLPPGSMGEAIFAGEATGQRQWSGELPDDGDYVIRVYLNRGASRQGVSGNYKLTVSLTGGQVADKEESEDEEAVDAKYDATGQVPCSMGGAPAGSARCDYGVKRGKPGEATFDVTPPGGLKRTLSFAGTRVRAGGGAGVKAARHGEDWLVDVNGYEHYVIPQALINGG